MPAPSLVARRRRARARLLRHRRAHLPVPFAADDPRSAALVLRVPAPQNGRTPADLAAKYNDNAEVKAFFASGKHLDGGSSSTAPPPPEEEEEEPWVRMCVPCDIEVYSALPQIFAEKLPVYEKDYKALGKAGLKKILGAPESWGMGPLEEMRMMKKMMRMKERAARRAQG